MTAGADIRLSDADLLRAWEAGAAATAVERAVAVATCAAPAEERVGEWTIGRRDALLLDIQAAAFGGDIELVTACPACDEALEVAFSAADVRSPCASAGAEHALDDPASGVRIVFRLPTSADLVAVDRFRGRRRGAPGARGALHRPRRARRRGGAGAGAARDGARRARRPRR